MLNTNTVVELDNYLKKNPNYLNKDEKQKLMKQFRDYIIDPKPMIEDPLLEFFVYIGEISLKEEKFLNYIVQKYPVSEFPRILEVATGKVCSLAQRLSKCGYRVTAIDPDIRIPQSDPRVKRIKLLKRKFTPDFRVDQYDVIVGYNACPVAGALLRKTNVPTVFTICGGPQSDGRLDIGKNVSSKKEFMEELEKRNGNIQLINGLTIVDNSRILEINKTEHERKID